VADFSCDAAPLAVRRERDAVPLDRALLDRALLERPLLDRPLLDRAPLERALLERDPLARDPLERELDARLEPDEPPDVRRLDDDELDPDPPLLACGTSPPLRGQRFESDTSFRPVSVARVRPRAYERHALEC
jgi:hypothetical protein